MKMDQHFTSPQKQPQQQAVTYEKPRKYAYAPHAENYHVERNMTKHQTALHVMDPEHTLVNKVVGYGCQ